MSDLIRIAIDPASGLDEAILSRVRSVGGGTVIEIIEMQRAIQPTIDRMAGILNKQLVAGMAAMSTAIIDGNVRVKEIPPWRFYKPVQIPQWQPPIRRPQQRSANMRKHARIVRSRMTPNERRRKQAQWERMKRLMKDAGIVNPKPSKFWRDLF